jgi:hypothetical protein
VQRHPHEPLEAVLLPDLPPPNSGGGAWKTWAIALSAFGLFVVCSGAGFWGLGKLVNLGFSGAGHRNSLVYAWETAEQRQANVATAMNAASPGCTAVELRELNRFFGRVLETLAEEEQEAFRDLVDHNAFAHRACLHPTALAAGDVDQSALESMLEYELDGPRHWQRFLIVHVARGAAANEAIVYGVLESATEQPTPLRWWLRRSGREWTICDWELIDRGQSEAARWARTQSLGDDPDNGTYWQAGSAIEQAAEDALAGRRGAAAAKLRDAEKHRLPAAVHDMTQVEAAIAWLHCGRPDLALAACDRVQDQEGDVGAVSVRARALWDLERFDEFLAAMDRYRALAGAHPELLRYEAEALESQGKRSAAADCWWEVLRLMPDDREALFEFCRSAAPPRRAENTHVFCTSKKPVDRAVEAAIQAIVRDESAAAEALTAYVRAQAPDSADLEHLTALQFDHDEQYVEAAAHYLKAHELETHPEEKKERFRAYLAAMAAAGKSLEAYQAADDPQAAFDYLTADYEYDEALIASEDLAQLVEAHRERAQDEPRMLYLSAKLLLDRSDFPAAAAAFLAAEARATDELSSLVRSGRLEAIYRRGSIKEAYEAYPEDRAEAFRELAWLAIGDDNWQALGELIGIHGRNDPADGWIPFFTAKREEQAGNFTAALTALASVSAADDAGLKYMSDRLRQDLYIQSDNVSQAYAAEGNSPETFLQLAGRLAEEGNWDRVLSLAQLHAAAAPADPNSVYFATKARWQLGQHELLVQNLTPWPDQKLQNLDQAWLTEIADQLVRSRLRTGAGNEARQAAEQLQADLGLDQPLLTAELALGNRPRALELLANPLIGREFFQRQLQIDEACGAVLTEPEFAEVRRRYGLQRPNDYGRPSASIVLLLKQAPEEARWQAAFDRAAGAASSSARTLTRASGDVPRTSRLVDLPGGTLVVTASSAPYCGEQDAPTSLQPDSPLRKAIAGHDAWIAIDLVLADKIAPARELELAAQKLAAELCDEQALAIYASLPRRFSPRLVLAEDAAREQLAAGTFLTADGNERNALYLYQIDAEADDSQPWPARRKALRELADQARVENPAGHAQVRVRLSRGHAEEDLWLNVVRSSRGSYRSEELLVEVTEPSRLWPHLAAGERIRIGYYEPLEVRERPKES